MPTKTGEDRGFQYYLERSDSLLNESVERQMISDVLGAFISGGLVRVYY